MEKRIKLSPVFIPTSSEHSAYQGMSYDLIRELTPGEEYDQSEENPRMYLIRLENGVELQVFNDEIEESEQQTMSIDIPLGTIGVISEKDSLFSSVSIQVNGQDVVSVVYSHFDNKINVAVWKDINPDSYMEDVTPDYDTTLIDSSKGEGEVQ